MARQWYHRVVIEGATQNGDWRPGRGNRVLNGTVRGNVLYQKARFSPYQMGPPPTWWMTAWGQRLQRQALVWRAEGVLVRA